MQTLPGWYQDSKDTPAGKHKKLDLLSGRCCDQGSVPEKSTSARGLADCVSGDAGKRDNSGGGGGLILLCPLKQ